MKHDLMFEVIPPAKNASEAYSKKLLDRIAGTLDELGEVKTLNIPEIIEENHIGEPYYKNADNREFASILREKCKKDIMLNTVVVHHLSKDKFSQWLDESINKYGIKNFVFVGAKINSISYPGPSIVDANLIAKNKNINFGNIFIPQRDNECERLISKTASGCSFFTSQVLLEPEKIIEVIKDYSLKCEKSNLKPAKFFLSFSPVSTQEDLNFIKWLGAQITNKTEKRLKSAQNIAEESIEVIIETLNKVLDFFDTSGINIPLGLNIEYISLHNLDLSKDLIKRFKYNK